MNCPLYPIIKKFFAFKLLKKNEAVSREIPARVHLVAFHKWFSFEMTLAHFHLSF
jgi:hypothetical protein